MSFSKYETDWQYNPLSGPGTMPTSPDGRTLGNSGYQADVESGHKIGETERPLSDGPDLRRVLSGRGGKQRLCNQGIEIKDVKKVTDR